MNGPLNLPIGGCLNEGHDENVSKMDVDGRRQCRPSTGRKHQSGRCRPVENLSLVDVDQENVCGVDIDR